MPAGGLEGWANYLRKNLKYPKTAKRKREEGRIYVQFVVNEDGSLSKIKTIKGASDSLNQEAERMIRESPNWNPGSIDGKPVKVLMVMPILFRLGR